MLKKIIILFYVTIAVSAAPLFANSNQSLTYNETTGEKSVSVQWNVSKTQAGQQIVVTSSGETNTFITDAQNRTLQWAYKGPKGEFVAKREADKIKINGSLDGEKINKEIEIDEKPWYQLIEHGLKGFITESSGEEVSFWVIRADDLEEFVMLAEKKERYTKSVLSAPAPVIDVLVSLASFPTFFWNVTYTFETSSGRYVAYRGKRGGYGVPETVVNLESVK